MIHRGLELVWVWEEGRGLGLHAAAPCICLNRSCPSLSALSSESWDTLSSGFQAAGVGRPSVWVGHFLPWLP